jgi:hypothetical protein
MARLIPNIDPRSIQNEPERRVAEALCEQFPKQVLVFHSYPWMRPERDFRRSGQQEVLREGEADFVVVHPKFGVLVIEVKGGKMFYDPVSGEWDRVGATHKVKDPFEQASNNMRALEALMKSRSFGGYNQLPFCRARCVIFPHCDFTGTMPPGADRKMLFGVSDLSSLAEKIESLFRHQPFVPQEPLSTSVLNGITQALTSTFKLVPALWSEIEEQERQILRFTEDQIRILDVLRSYRRAAIRGVAGSGKTMLAMSKARAFADEGKRVLFVCFNEMLAAWLDSQLPDSYKNQVIVRNYHKLCREWVLDAGLKWPNTEGDDEFFKTEAPALLEHAIDLQADRLFDAVVVDEGQDFQRAWWDTIELINKRPTEGELYVFYDPDQQIFNKSLDAMPDLGNPFELPVNCRNTESIVAHCGRILGKTIRVNAGTPCGRSPNLIVAATAADQKKTTASQVAEWTASPARLRSDQIAVVTRGKVELSSLADISSIDGKRIVKNIEEWKSGQGILLTSLYKFKGLEADALILVDIEPTDVNAPPYGFRPEHYYVGCSRAKHLLTIISRSKIDL